MRSIAFTFVLAFLAIWGCTQIGGSSAAAGPVTREFAAPRAKVFAAAAKDADGGGLFTKISDMGTLQIYEHKLTPTEISRSKVAGLLKPGARFEIRIEPSRRITSTLIGGPAGEGFKIVFDFVDGAQPDTTLVTATVTSKAVLPGDAGKDAEREFRRTAGKLVDEQLRVIARKV